MISCWWNIEAMLAAEAGIFPSLSPQRATVLLLIRRGSLVFLPSAQGTGEIVTGFPVRTPAGTVSWGVENEGSYLCEEIIKHLPSHMSTLATLLSVSYSFIGGITLWDGFWNVPEGLGHHPLQGFMHPVMLSLPRLVDLPAVPQMCAELQLPSTPDPNESLRPCRQVLECWKLKILGFSI